MTAMNAFGRPYAAYLLADAASYTADGTVEGIGVPKVACCSRLRILIGTSGQTGPDCLANIEDWLDLCDDQAAVFAGLPALLRDLEADAADARRACERMHARARARGVPEARFPEWVPIGMRLTLAWWDGAEKRGRAGIMGSMKGAISSGGEPFVLRPVGTIFSPALSPDFWPDHSFDPEAHAEELARLQRATADEAGIYRVGGSFTRYRVDRGGISRVQVCEWPDVVGQPLKVSA